MRFREGRIDAGFGCITDAREIGVVPTFGVGRGDRELTPIVRTTGGRPFPETALWLSQSDVRGPAVGKGRTGNQSRPPMYAEAITIIRACITGVRWSTVNEQPSAQESTADKAAAEQFEQDVRVWLSAVRRASERRWRPSEAWHFAFRLHLGLIVGSAARSELGRAADQPGYQLLAHEFRILFGSYSPRAKV